MVQTKGKSGDGNWLANKPIMATSLDVLRKAGIQGIRLVVYPNEITHDGKTFAWQPFETILDLCKQHELLVDICVGPYQYPNYPGIYLPEALLEFVHNSPRSLDTTAELQTFGKLFLQKQLERYGNDSRIRGFHLANEWPDHQLVLGREKVKTWVSEAFMLWCAKYLKEHTDKPIAINTNISVASRRKLIRVFGELLALLEKPGRLGFDIYPSQETWRKAFFPKLHRLIQPYASSFRSAQKLFPLSTFYFCEVEAQPWGGGQSWFELLTSETNPEEKVLGYTRNSLPQTIRNYVKPSNPEEVSLWGADFWLSAYAFGVTWPLEQIQEIAKTS